MKVDTRANHPKRYKDKKLDMMDQSVTVSQQQLWICISCGWVYDPREGDPDGGIPAGTHFEDIPDAWFCPVCGARKTEFEPFEE